MDNPLTQDLGTRSGRLLVFGGPYSNLQALEALKAIADQLQIPAGNIICTGDIVGYCAQPEAAVQFVKDWGVHAIQGNVEQNIIRGEDDCGCNFAEGSRCDLLSRAWFPYAVRSLSAGSVAWLSTLPLQLAFRYAGKAVAVLHGAATGIADFVFATTPWPVKEISFAATGAEVILAGHAGLPFADERAGQSWLNAGVIGMPANDGTPRVWYVLLDDTDGQFSYTFHAFTYDNGTAHQLMRANGLPDSYAHTLLTGIWDNCEILPEAEKALQGRPITLHHKANELRSSF
ncbi:metallophosphoesterase family protein [Hymenobacter sp. BT770]|uniref:metallophosphoesterase family protein n=1 Tax=Hymenobacter sp. BT770 TaxID=2886942 RepID=UPI001D11BF84|nr:metallophosphoesterase family protein [Hymenobacter sp. BT770]MCC3155506.1 metallophosphatase family protein [Hymenobacter sp. BT770]MDO3417513.1 metallophosphoesterase family protein [Hymenobacter sp. BT770]